VQILVEPEHPDDPSRNLNLESGPCSTVCQTSWKAPYVH
jgi:hypothetical protein